MAGGSAGAGTAVNAIARGRVLALQEAVAQLPQLDLPVAHFFIKGVYVRALPIPAGAAVVGKRHLQEHIVIVTKGHLRIRNMATDELQDFYAGDTWVSQPGSQRAIFAVEDSCITTVHRTDETDVEVIENTLVTVDHWLEAKA